MRRPCAPQATVISSERSSTGSNRRPTDRQIAIPRELLNKPGRLSDEEFALIRTHVPIGCEIMAHIAPPWPLQSIIAQHHERLDGSGYPHGLTRASIEIEPRLVDVCDVFEALCDDRPYRKALGVQGALDELRRSSGKTLLAPRLDPALRCS